MRNPNIEKTLLDEVTEAGSSDGKLVEVYRSISFQIVAADVTDGADVVIETSLDGTNYVSYKTFNITANGSDYYAITGEIHKYMRATVENYTDGTYTVLLFAGY